ncbi:MAG: prepilin-type N-terminal cleavage/methylation domain-containing protein [Bdellovibrionales bacterium]|nr:prepilin-type N-terminal cleavage/methylation domain-containing protein [Bdellovibrionales bacterium]
MLNQRAFSLIEVLTTVLLLAGLISLVVQISYGNSRRAKKTRHLEKMSQILENKMLDLKTEFQGPNIINLPASGEGEFEQEPYYTWFYETQKIPLPSEDIILSLIQIPQTQLNEQWVQSFKSILSDTVIELKLTVFYNPPKKEKSIELSLSSYFVNYEESPSFILNQIMKFIPKGSSL